MQCNAVQRSAAQHSEGQCNAVQCSAVMCSAVQIDGIEGIIDIIGTHIFWVFWWFGAPGFAPLH